MCLGDILAVSIGVVVVCVGVLLWALPTVGQFGSDGIGVQRLAELTTGLGLTTVVIWGLLLYSLVRQARTSETTPSQQLGQVAERL